MAPAWIGGTLTNHLGLWGDSKYQIYTVGLQYPQIPLRQAILCVTTAMVEARRAFMEFSVETGLERRPPA